MWTSGEGQKAMFWRKVNTMPGEGSPRRWEEMGGGFEDTNRIIRVLFGSKYGKRANPSKTPTEKEFGEYIELYPLKAVIHGIKVASTPHRKPEWMYNWDEDRGGGIHPNSYLFYLPRLCNHCTHPACMEACPRNAIYKREDGVVLINEERCHGYRFCMEACPYKVIYFNINGMVAGEYTTTGSETGIAQKCIACYPRIEQRVAPACARSCPARAVHFGYLDDENSSVYKLVKKWKVALPLHPEFGTQPNVYYIPPLSSPKYDGEGRLTNEPRIPLDYLKTLFGDGVEDALSTIREEREKMRRGERSELMEILIGFRWPDDFFGTFKRHLHKIEV
jgi:ethylbenzene hydroxylase subunit beta/complex iron-sulfur molybdoenzyme family reductase subunit beta